MNRYILETVKEKRMLIDVIRSRKKKWIGHVLRRNGRLKETIEGRIERKRPQRRRQVMTLDGMKEKKELYTEMKQRACDRNNWRTEVLKTCPKAENQ